MSNPYEGTWYTLGYPNREVREAFNRQILHLLQGDSETVSLPVIREAIESANYDLLRTVFHSFFASIPHDWYKNNPIATYEGYYASVVYTYFASLGYEVIPEDTSNKGRVNLTVKTRTGIWIFEIKVLGIDKSGDESPLDQIKRRGYAEKYRSDQRPIHEIGIVFNPKTRNIDRWEI